MDYSLLFTTAQSYSLYLRRMISKLVLPVIKDRFYCIFDQQTPKDLPKAFFFNIDSQLSYEAYYEDFGPLNLAMIYKYVREVDRLLNEPKYQKSVLYHHTSQDMRKATNSTLLICAYMLIMKHKTAEEAYAPFREVDFRPYRDASYGQCSYECTIMDCLRGLEYAMGLDWFSLKGFNLASYEHYEKIENGDINWVLPGKLLAFSSPSSNVVDVFGNRSLTPKEYLPIFYKLGVTAVIRLNNQLYDAREFKDHGINHYDLYFTDGTPPGKEILLKFLQICEQEKGAIAVHCKAGLGRTGTLIGCYVMKHYHIGAAEYIAWARMCRPGSVLGPQQYFLQDNEVWLKEMGAQSPIWLANKNKMLNIHCVNHTKYKMSEYEKAIEKQGDNEQGNFLMEGKKKNAGLTHAK